MKEFSETSFTQPTELTESCEAHLDAQAGARGQLEVHDRAADRNCGAKLHVDGNNHGHSCIVGTRWVGQEGGLFAL